FITQLSLTVNKLIANKVPNLKESNLKVSHLKERPPITLTLNDTFLSYAVKPAETKPFDVVADNTKQDGKQAIKLSLQQSNFTLAAQLDVSALQPLSKQPAIITATGVIKQNQDDWQIKLGLNTQITLSALSLAATTGDKADISAANLATKVQGAISIAKDISTARDNNPQQKSTQSKAKPAGKISLALQLSSELSRLQLAKVIHIKRLQLTADISGNSENISVNGQVVADNVAVAKINISGALAQPKLEVLANEVLITDLLALNVNLPVDVKLIDGKLSYHLIGPLQDLAELMDEPMTSSINNTMKLSISLQDITGEIGGTWLQDLNWQQTLRLEKGHITSMSQGKSPVNNLRIAMIESAVPIENFSAQIQLNFQQQRLALMANNMRGEILGGSFNIAKAQWPFQAERSVNVQLNSIDLEKLLDLDQQQSIVVTGNISGHLPVYFDGQQCLIKAGELHNVSNGIIQVMNNAAVVELKASSTELKLAFDALQNLHYHQLTSAVSMADDGYMLLATVIKGRNPELDNEVNLNLNLNYDLLGLLQSLNITEQLEKRIIKHSQQKIQQH
ncbi:MAG: YdbH domain-containing protein, partial [Colwellia sp.]|nr:YdbH domain-containing protein [Colwellia sp.]